MNGLRYYFALSTLVRDTAFVQIRIEPLATGGAVVVAILKQMLEKLLLSPFMMRNKQHGLVFLSLLIQIVF